MSTTYQWYVWMLKYSWQFNDTIIYLCESTLINIKWSSPHPTHPSSLHFLFLLPFLPFMFFRYARSNRPIHFPSTLPFPYAWPNMPIHFASTLPFHYAWSNMPIHFPFILPFLYVRPNMSILYVIARFFLISLLPFFLCLTHQANHQWMTNEWTKGHIIISSHTISWMVNHNRL